jgi:hypothetical protein
MKRRVAIMNITRRVYAMKKSLSIKQFTSEFGENFSELMKKKLNEFESRCFLTRKDISYRFDLKHVEHIQFECACDSEGVTGTCRKEYAYGQFIVVDGILYFSQNCVESNDVMKSPAVSTIYNALDSEIVNFEGIGDAKKVDDSNIEYIVDNILAVCPQVSQSYLDITQGMVYRAESK